MIYAEALDLLARTPDTSAKSRLWTANTQELAKARQACTNEYDFIRWLTSVNHFTTPHLNPDPMLGIICQQWMNHLESVTIEESPYANKDGIVMAGCRRVSTAMLQMTYYAQRIDTVKPETILEIGAGFGGLARILASTAPRAYTILDLPDSLFCSYVYLRTNFPEHTFSWCDDVSKLGQPADFRFVPADFWQHLYPETFDMAINTCSMGEMLPENRDNYMELIEETSRYFYSHNRHGTHRFPTLPGDTALPAIVLDNDWEILFDEIEGAAQTDPATPPSRELLVRRCER